MAKNGDGEFAFLICQFAISPSPHRGQHAQEKEIGTSTTSLTTYVTYKLMSDGVQFRSIIIILNIDMQLKGLWHITVIEI